MHPVSCRPLSGRLGCVDVLPSGVGGCGGGAFEFTRGWYFAITCVYRTRTEMMLLRLCEFFLSIARCCLVFFAVLYMYQSDTIGGVD